MNIPSANAVSRSVAGAVESLPIDRLESIDIPDLGDVWSDASEFVTDSAAVIGKHGGRVARSTARSAWRNKSTVVTVAVLVLAVIGVISIVKRRRDDDVENY